MDVETRTDWVVAQSNDRESRFLTSAALLGRRVAAADHIIEEEERKTLREALQECLHLAGDTDELLEELLEEAVSSDITMEEDIEKIVGLADDMEQPELLQLFAFACRIAGADEEFQAEEQSLLSKLATIFGIETTHRNALLSTYCGQSPSADVNPDTLEELSRELRPASLPDFGPSIHEIARDHTEDVVEFQEGLTDSSGQKDEPDASTASSTSNREVREEFSSKIREALEGSPDRRRLLSSLEEVFELPDKVLSQTRRRDLEQVRNRAEDEKFRIAVVGKFSSGKSTLLNALCREVSEELFPTSIVPCTGTVSILRHSDELSYRIRDEQGAEKELGEEDFRDTVTLSEDEERDEALEDPDAEAVVVEYPLPICEGGVELVDTPGLDENPRRSSITDRYLTQADAVIFVSSATQLLTQKDKKFIRENLVERIDPRDLFFVVNFFDQIEGEKERKKVRQRGKSFFEDLYPESVEGSAYDRVHFLSAKQVLEERGDNEESRFVESFEAFEKAIGQYLSDAKGAERWERAARETQEELVHVEQNASAKADEQFDDVENKLREAKQQVKETRKTKQRLKRQRHQAIENIQDEKQKALRKVEKRLRSQESSLRRLIERRSEHWETDASPLWNKSQIEEDFAEQLKEDIREGMSRWCETELSALLEERLSSLKDRLNDQFADLNEELRSLEERTGLDLNLSTPSAEDDEEAWVKFMKGAGGWVAGGPVGALVGTNLEVEDIAKNAATNIGLGLMAGILGIGGPLSIAVVVAAVGAYQLFSNSDVIIDKIREGIVDAGVETVPEVISEAETQLSEELGDLFDEIEDATVDAINAQIEDIEAQVEGRMELLEEAKTERDEAEKHREEWQQYAEAVREIGEELEEVSGVNYGNLHG